MGYLKNPAEKERQITLDGGARSVFIYPLVIFELFLMVEDIALDDVKKVLVLNQTMSSLMLRSMSVACCWRKLYYFSKIIYSDWSGH